MEHICYRNLKVWLADKCESPGIVKNLLTNRRAWGVFSIYAHLRRSDRKPKKAFATKEEALREAEVMGKRHDAHFGVYKCLYCDGWHTAKEYDNKVADVPQETFNIRLKSDRLDVAKALSTEVPDIMPVYGGLRGRTLSGNHQRYAWKPLAEAGIKQIIDLREDYEATHYTDLCKAYGMDYFKYPVNKHANTIAEMVRLFPEFCRLIDRGNFYIACAQGLHRTDIALCCYWMFYAADKGIEPPTLNGYVSWKGHRTDKIMQVLGAYYSYVEKTTGRPPIPIDVFKERKKIIKELSEEQHIIN